MSTTRPVAQHRDLLPAVLGAALLALTPGCNRSTNAAASIAAGYVAFGSLSEAWPPRLQAFGAGALFAMIAETMIPEAFHNSPRFSGLLAAFGFGLLLLVDVTTR